MRSKTSTWFEIKIRYEKTMENGMQKKVTEQYVIDALTWGEAEKRIIEEMKQYISGDFKIIDIRKSAYNEVFFSDRESADRWYKTKVQFITIDEKSEMEKKSNIVYLINGSSVDDASRNLTEIMSSTLIDYVKTSVSETNILDLFEYNTDEIR